MTIGKQGNMLRVTVITVILLSNENCIVIRRNRGAAKTNSHNYMALSGKRIEIVEELFLLNDIVFMHEHCDFEKQLH